MQKILFGLAIVASTLAILAQCNDLKKCDFMSEELADRYSENHVLVEFIKHNCPSTDMLRHMIYVEYSSVYTPEEIKARLGPYYKDYKLYSEQKEEQEFWLREADSKVDDYYFELQYILESKDAVGKTIKYPDSSSFDSLLKEVDNDKDRQSFDYFTSTNDPYGVIRFVEKYDGFRQLFNVDSPEWIYKSWL